MTKPHVDSLELVNDSGYPFQLCVEEIVKNGTDSHYWRVIGREKPWRDQESGEEGYIDLLLAKDSLRMVIECKSPKQPQDWIFLIEQGREPTTQRVCCLLLKEHEKGENDISPLMWMDLDRNLVSFESDFCVREQDDRNRPLLERQSNTLLQSIECLAEEEHLLQQEGNAALDATYIPVIVTTAQLKVCIFKASDVGILDGKIPDGVGTFQQIDYIRFRKTILTKYPTLGKRPRDLAEAGRLQQRTIIIVQAQNAEKLSKFLYWV